MGCDLSRQNPLTGATVYPGNTENVRIAYLLKVFAYILNIFCVLWTILLP